MITGKYPSLRLRRSRKYDWSRRLIEENSLSPNDFILPIFLIEGKNKKQEINLLQEKLIALNPSEILSRGYSITFNEKGEAIDNANKLDQGQIVVTQLAKGKFKSRVEN